MLLAALVGATWLAGCTAPPGVDACGREVPAYGDASAETWRLEVRTDQPFSLVAPIRTAPGGTTPEVWLSHPIVPAGWDVGWADLEEGAGVRVTGAGPGVVVACATMPARDGQPAEDYLRNEWSLVDGTTASGGSVVAVHGISGTGEVVVHYVGQSRWCGADLTAAGAFSPGLHGLRSDGSVACE